MKKTIILSAMLVTLSFVTMSFVTSNNTEFVAANDKHAEITFDTLKIDLGTFPETQPEQKCAFEFTNTGNAPLVINQAFATCGCTIPNYSKTPIKPGERGKIEVTYNGTGKFPGKFSKTITVRSNASNEIVRLTISGNMTAK